MNENKFNIFENKESKEQVTSKVELHFFRHSIKGKHEDDNEVLLTPEGRELAQSQGEEDFNQSVAFGSPRKRTQETASYMMAGGSEEITGEEGLDELINKINSETNLGSKVGIDERLNFNLDESKDSEYVKKIYSEFSSGNYFKFLINESDTFAESVGDTESLTYQRGVDQIGSILKKYLKVSNRWNDIRENDNNEKYKSDTLKRFMGSHQGVTECFLAKVIEDRLGKEKLNEFIEILDNKGFDFTEGYQVDIDKLSNGEKKVRVSYKKELEDGGTFEINENITEKELLDIIN
ncbi:MAG: hypothetical protein ACI9AR_000436 [Flavobacteriaceae bacterium]|jgi:hypothetical protein